MQASFQGTLAALTIWLLPRPHLLYDWREVALQPSGREHRAWRLAGSMSVQRAIIRSSCMPAEACVASSLLCRPRPLCAHHAVHQQARRHLPPPRGCAIAAAACGSVLVVLQGHGTVHIPELDGCCTNGAGQQLDGHPIIKHAGCLERVLLQNGSTRLKKPLSQHRQQAPAARRVVRQGRNGLTAARPTRPAVHAACAQRFHSLT